MKCPSRLSNSQEHRSRRENGLTDHELIDAARGGDERAFEELVRRHERLVAASVVGMLGPGPEARDVGQETFVRFFESLDRFRKESSLGTYLVRIAINLSLNELERRRKRRERYVDDPAALEELAGSEPGPDRILEQERLRKALLALEPDFRAVVVLRLRQGFSTEETARILGVPQGTVLSRLSRAQKTLRDILRRDEA